MWMHAANATLSARYFWFLTGLLSYFLQEETGSGGLSYMLCLPTHEPFDSLHRVWFNISTDTGRFYWTSGSQTIVSFMVAVSTATGIYMQSIRKYRIFLMVIYYEYDFQTFTSDCYSWHWWHWPFCSWHNVSLLSDTTFAVFSHLVLLNE